MVTSDQNWICFSSRARRIAGRNEHDVREERTPRGSKIFGFSYRKDGDVII